MSGSSSVIRTPSGPAGAEGDDAARLGDGEADAEAATEDAAAAGLDGLGPSAEDAPDAKPHPEKQNATATARPSG